MITRFYVDNYKSLVNFEYKPKAFELILGANGSGKSTVFEALEKVREIIAGRRVDDVFSASDRTKWSKSYLSAFEIEIKDGSDEIKYHLRVHISSDYISIDEESLFVNGTERMRATETTEPEIDEKGQVIKMHHTLQASFHGSSLRIPLPPLLSVMSQYSLSRYKEILSKTFFCKINPPVMTSEIGKMTDRASTDYSNFSSIYLYLSQQRQGEVFQMLPYLREAIQGLDYFRVKEDFEKGKRELQVVFNLPVKGLEFSFADLSDGQRALIVLYTIIFCVLDENTTLIIDEPENFISSRELQPWLMLLRERIEDYGGQAILISHHPEFINVMAPQDAIQFRRVNGGPVQIRPFETAQYEGLTPAEIVARGWDNE